MKVVCRARTVRRFKGFILEFARSFGKLVGGVGSFVQTPDARLVPTWLFLASPLPFSFFKCTANCARFSRDAHLLWFVAVTPGRVLAAILTNPGTDDPNKLAAGLLPKVSCLHFWCAGLSVDDFGAQHKLHILFPSGGASRIDDLGQMGGVDEKLAGGDSAAAADTCGHNKDLSRIAISELGDDGIVAIVVGCLLFRAIDNPVNSVRVIAVGYPETRHIGVICEVEAQRLGQSKRPSVVECPYEHGRPVAQVGESSRGFSLEAVLRSVRLQNTRNLDYRT